MDLISTTVSPTTWDEVGGPGSMREYRTGVYVDAEGVVRKAVRNTTGSGLAVARLEAARKHKPVPKANRPAAPIPILTSVPNCVKFR